MMLRLVVLVCAGLLVATTSASRGSKEESRHLRDPFRKNNKVRGDAFYHNYDWSENHAKCIVGAADQGGCGSCWTWATARAYAERLCQQSFYGVRIWPSPYLTENCYSHGAKPHMVCGGGNSEIFAQSMKWKGSIPMTLYPGPPDYYKKSPADAEKTEQTCEWSSSRVKSPRSKIVAYTEPWLKVVEKGVTYVKAPALGEDRTSFIRDLQDELSNYGPVVLDLFNLDRPACCKEHTCAQTGDNSMCSGHAVVLHGWETDPDSGKFSWLAKNSWGRSRMPKWMNKLSGSSIDSRGITRYEDGPGLAQTANSGDKMYVASYSTFIPDTEYYLDKVKLESTCHVKQMASSPASSSASSALPDCSVYAPTFSLPSKPKWAIFSSSKKKNQAAFEAKKNEYNELVNKEIRCKASKVAVWECPVRATVPMVMYFDESASLTLRLRLRPPASYCAARDVLNATSGCTKLDQSECRTPSCEWRVGAWGGDTTPRVLHTWAGVKEDGAGVSMANYPIPADAPSKTKARESMSVSTDVYLPTVDLLTDFSDAQVLRGPRPIEYASVEMLGWGFDAYNTDKNIRADGEGHLKNEGAVLRTVDLFLGDAYQDVSSACDMNAPMSAYCDGGQDRACVQALGRYLDRHKIDAWVQVDKTAVGSFFTSKKKVWAKKKLSLETMHASSASKGGSCLHIPAEKGEKWETSKGCAPLCGGTVARGIETVTVQHILSHDTKCAGFDFVGTKGFTWSICLNDVTRGAAPTDGDVARAAQAQRMVCLAVRWAALKASPLPDKQQAKGGPTCSWPGGELTPRDMDRLRHLKGAPASTSGLGKLNQQTELFALQSQVTRKEVDDDNLRKKGREKMGTVHAKL